MHFYMDKNQIRFIGVFRDMKNYLGVVCFIGFLEDMKTYLGTVCSRLHSTELNFGKWSLLHHKFLLIGPIDPFYNPV